MSQIIQYLLNIIGYFIFCRFSYTLLKYFNQLRKNSSETSQSLREKFDVDYIRNVKGPYSKYKERHKDLDPQRSYYKIWTTIAILLVCFNSFILAEFLNNIGNLSKAILLDPIRLNYSHLLAGVIVIVELFTGAGYYIFHKNQNEHQDESQWAALKWFSIAGFLCLLFVETVMWMNLSINFEMSEKLLLSKDNVFVSAFDYFLAALGIGITFFEFCVGYLTSYYKSYSGESHFFQVSRNFFYSIGLILLLFLPFIFLIILQGIITILSELIKITVMPGNYIYENIFKKTDKTI